MMDSLLDRSVKSAVYIYSIAPPTFEEVESYCLHNSVSSNQKLFCSNIDDVPVKPLEVGGDILKISSDSVSELEEFESVFENDGLEHWRALFKTIRAEMPVHNEIETKLVSSTEHIFRPLIEPPSYHEVRQWVSTRNALLHYNENQLKPKRDINCLEKETPQIKSKDFEEDSKKADCLNSNSSNLPKTTPSNCDIPTRGYKSQKMFDLITSSSKSHTTFHPLSSQSPSTSRAANIPTNSKYNTSTPLPPHLNRCDGNIVSTRLLQRRGSEDTIRSTPNTQKRRRCSGSEAQEQLKAVSPLQLIGSSQSNNLSGGSAGLAIKKEDLLFSPILDQNKTTQPIRGNKRPVSLLQQFSNATSDEAKLEKVSLNVTAEEPAVLDDDQSSSSDDIIESSQPDARSNITTLNIKRRKSSGSSAKRRRKQSPLPSSAESAAEALSPATLSPTPPVNITHQTPASPDSNASGLPDSPSILHRKDSSIRKLLLDSQFKRHFHLASQHSLPAVNQQEKHFNEVDQASLQDSYGFLFENHDLQSARALHQHQFVSSLCLEAHVSCRGKLLPDPRHDPVLAIVLLGIRDSPPDYPSENISLVIAVGGCNGVELPSDVTLIRVPSEQHLIDTLVTVVRTWDPDILIGYEVQNKSWGYILERCVALGGKTLVSQLSRIPDEDPNNLQSHHDPELDQYGAAHTSHIHMAGRIVLNIWRLMRGEVSLTRYTLQNVAHHVLHVRIPRYSYDTLRHWWTQDNTQGRVLSHYLLRARATMQLLERLDFINRTSELARIFGIEFYDVLARGTQYRVESLMLRLSRSYNMVALSPSIQQRANMQAPEWVALTMEPYSRLYTDPVIVLDFQSLYPSVMIAYNYCYSTCLGRVDRMTGPQPFVFGAGQLEVDREELVGMIDELNIAPCGVAFVPKRVRLGILPQMLQEILDTRIMVKQSMKLHKDNETLQKVLHSRQLGLKLIANVTYGYTSANFSGRMPCVEVGDSVVSKGRETLERSIQLVHSHPTWGGKVVYGDTDSMFIHLPGRTKDQAFDIGQEIAHTVTQIFPKPIKLKFEKVYMPCILQTKKRYTGFMYESKDQAKPELECKGIEVVRRDGCPLVVKALEQSLNILFSKLDASLLRRYLSRQFTRLLAGEVPLKDLIFAKEYRGAKGYRPGACVPALHLARQRLLTDPRSEPLAGERVPYVIVYGAPGVPLIRLVRCPLLLLSPEGANLRPNYTYYASKVLLPALHRCFSLVGVNVIDWYKSMPRPLSSDVGVVCRPVAPGGAVTTISQFFSSVSCVACGKVTQTHKQNNTGGGSLCSDCRGRPQECVLLLQERVREAERLLDNCSTVCRACMSFQAPSNTCISLDCPHLYTLTNSARQLKAAQDGVEPLLDSFF